MRRWCPTNTIDTQCPKCSNIAARILSEGRYYIYCAFCGTNIIAKTIKAGSTNGNALKSSSSRRLDI